jgi:hypothetical protein
MPDVVPVVLAARWAGLVVPARHSPTLLPLVLVRSRRQVLTPLTIAWLRADVTTRALVAPLSALVGVSLSAQLT